MPFYIYFACLSVCLFVCLFVCLYPINVKTAEPIRHKFCVGAHVAQGRFIECLKNLKTHEILLKFRIFWFFNVCTESRALTKFL